MRKVDDGEKKEREKSGENSCPLISLPVDRLQCQLVPIYHLLITLLPPKRSALLDQDDNNVIQHRNIFFRLDQNYLTYHLCVQYNQLLYQSHLFLPPKITTWWHEVDIMIERTKKASP